MPVGLQVFNDFGTVQIDQDSFTLAYHSKGSVTLDSRVHPNFTTDINSSIASQAQFTWMNSTGVGGPPGFGGLGSLLAFRPQNYYPVGVGFGPESYNTGPQFYGYTTDPVAPIVDWWYFTRPSVRNSGVGLEIYNADGQVAYTDNALAMKLGAVVNDSTGGINLPYPGDWAISVGSPFPGIGSYVYETGDGQFHYQEYGAMWNTTGGNFARSNNMMAARKSFSTDQFHVSSGSIRATQLLIDVTGL